MRIGNTTRRRILGGPYATLKTLFFGATAVLLMPAGSSTARAAGLVSTCDESHLRSALSGGGGVTFACSGNIPLARTLTISVDTNIDASGQKVTFDGRNSIGVLRVNSGVTLSLNNLTIVNANGGSFAGAINNSGNLVVANSALVGNVGAGGGISNIRGTALVTNSTLFGNIASTGAGGGIVNGGALTVINSTLSSNFANNGGGIYNYSGTVMLENTILAANTGGDCDTKDGGTITDGGYNLDDDGSCGLSSAKHSLSNNQNANLGLLSNNSGPSPTVPLLSSSAVIGAVPPGADGCATYNAADQRGITRPASVNGNCSIGAYEFVPLATSVITDCSTDSQLQAAVEAGGRIAFSCSGDIKLSNPLVIVANTSIDGTGESVTLDGSDSSYVFNAGRWTLALNNVTVANGDVGILVLGGELIITNSKFTDNSLAIQTPPQFGAFGGWMATITNTTFAPGDIYSEEGEVTIYNSTFSGGTVQNFDGVLSVINSTFVNSGITNETSESCFSSQATIVSTTLFRSGIGNGADFANGSCPPGRVLMTLQNTIVVNGGCGYDISNPIQDGGYNLDDNGSCGFSSANHSFSNNKNANLGTLSDNGGPTQTIPLLYPSVAIDAGACDEPVDQRGVLRPQGPACDIGAYEANQIQLSFDTSPTGLSYMIGSTTYTTPQSLFFVVGGEYPISTPSPQPPGATETRYVWQSWSDNAPQSHSITVPATPASYTACFQTQNFLITGVNPSGAGIASPPSEWYAANAIVDLSAAANPGYFFADWTGNVANPGSTSTTVTMNQPQTVTANFAQILTSGSGCNGVYSGSFNGNVTVTKGQNCTFINGAITGNVTLNGGNLALTNMTVGGNVQVNGGAFVIGPGTIVNSNLQIQNIPTGTAQNQVCGANVHGNLQFHNNGTAVDIGSATPSSCPGNVIGGNLEVHNNAAATTLYSNTIYGNLQDNNNTAPTQVFGNNIANSLQCQSNTSITGGENVAKQKQGQCSGF